MKKYLFIVIALFTGFLGEAQTLKDGLYLTIDDFRNNDPVLPAYLINTLDIRKADYLDKVVELEEIKYYDKAENEQVVSNEDLWGYCRGGVVFVVHDEQFSRLQVIGSICHFTTVVEVISYVSDPYYRMGMDRKVVTEEMVFNILDLSAGQFYRFTADNMEIILQRDPVLIVEFLSLKEKEREKFLFRFMTRYNERHAFNFGE